MEQWAGARLLHRTTRKLSLTDAGERTLERCQQMLALAGEIDLVEEGQSDELRGLLRITCSQSLGQTELVGAVAQYLKRHPQVAVDLQMNNRAVNLVEEPARCPPAHRWCAPPDMPARRTPPMRRWTAGGRSGWDPARW
ncbi:LysR family transcriptional regulator [Pseudomonas aeruginosa]